MTAKTKDIHGRQAVHRAWLFFPEVQKPNVLHVVATESDASMLLGFVGASQALGLLLVKDLMLNTGCLDTLKSVNDNLFFCQSLGKLFFVIGRVTLFRRAAPVVFFLGKCPVLVTIGKLKTSVADVFPWANDPQFWTLRSPAVIEFLPGRQWKLGSVKIVVLDSFCIF